MNTNPLIPLLISSTVLITLFAVYFVMFLIAYKNKQRQNQLQQQRLRHEFESELLNSRLEMQEVTLNRVSMEIHDSICQNLGAIKHQLSHVLIDPERRDETLSSAAELLSDNIKQLRSISHTLNTNHVHETGLLGAIEEEVNFKRAMHDIIFRLNIMGDEEPLSDETELLLFRVFQEAISNSIRHGKASEIDISINYLPEMFAMQIKDNGTGFDTELHNKQKGIGLSNMKQRVGLVNGTFIIQSAPGNGTRINISIALKK